MPPSRKGSHKVRVGEKAWAVITVSRDKGGFGSALLDLAPQVSKLGPQLPSLLVLVIENTSNGAAALE